MHSGKGPPNLGAGTHCLRLADKQPAKCEVAHTSPPLARGTRTGTGTTRLLEPGGVHGTKTSEFRICHRDGVDRPRGHDVGDGFADHVTDLPPSASAFVLRRSTRMLLAKAIGWAAAGRLRLPWQ